MKKHQICFILIIIVFMITGISDLALSQYWGERVLEKSFEQMDFFFMPNYLNPYGLSNFSATTPGLIDDPLLNLIVNPANLYSDSSRKTYFYLDFRNSQIKEDKNYYYYPYPYLDAHSSYSADMIYYPNYFINTRKALEPVFSTALLTRPLRSLKGLFLGFSYQLIFQNEGYYSVPQDIYRSNIGYDYAGNKVAETSNMPIVDRYKGADDMRQTGHFLSFFAGYEISSRLQLGFRLNRTIFDRDGSYGSQNFWDNTSQYQYTSISYDMRWRDQSYDHWDLAGGLSLKLSDRTKFGIQGGYLWANADQSYMQEDSSLYKSGQINVGTEWNYYHKQGGSNQDWGHDDKTYYGGVNLNHQLDETKSLIFYYTYFQQNADITLGSTLTDSSYSNYHYEWDTDYYYSEWDYALQDVRTGTGERINKSHRFMGALQWEIERNKKLHIGLNVEFLKRQINTDEHVLLNRHSRSKYNSSYNPSNQNYFDATKEDKNLLWEFKADVVNFQIPIIFTWKLSEAVEILLGLNRRMTNWDIDDMTLAIFKYRETTSDTVTTKKTNFGERYTEPSERRSDVQTTMLGGITISPSKLFNVRLLAVPNFSNTYQGTTLKEFQWWIEISLYP